MNRISGTHSLGLTISRAIIEAHGGRMWAESAGRGGGAQLVVRLPAISTGAGGGSAQRAGGDGAR